MKVRTIIFILFTIVLSACSASVDPVEEIAVEEQTSSENSEASSGSGSKFEAGSPQDTPPRSAEIEFSTDFTIHSIPYTEVLSGGPSKDGIAPVDDPHFISVEEATGWLADVEPVIRVEFNGETKAYPIQILMWHEIVNDEVGGEPITVTFCPLCNTGLAFLRTLDGLVMDFGTTGRLRFSNLIMYDRQTETWWQQATGEGIAGIQTGKQLEFVQAPIISWEQFRNAYPDGKVLSANTGFVRSYGNNPYAGYDDVNRPPFLYQGPILPDDLPPVARILALGIGDEYVAYPYLLLEDIQVANDNVGGEDIVVIWESGTASALDARVIAEGRDVGTANAYLRELNGESLSFIVKNGVVIDEQSGSQWNSLGRAIAGELMGSQLEEILSFNHFWFSWAVFMPETRIYKAN